jgi:asparagine synthase (glutamine-hydrolysing)
MPGLVGFTDKNHNYNSNMLFEMRNLLKHFDSYIDEELYSDENIYASRTHLGIIQHGNQPCILNNRFFSWMEGEFYNQKELKSKYNVTSKNCNELLADIYRSTRSFRFLKDIDGYYAAVMYDNKKQKVHLISDRFGLRPLYWGILKGDLVWSCELKGFLAHTNFEIIIDRQAVEEFFNVGYQLENRTWFEGVELVPPASIVTYDIKKSNISIVHYWSWNEFNTIKEPIEEKELIEELGRLFKQSVSRRINKNDKIGITLSGGLDSRAILAAVGEDYKPIHTFTFGKEGCDDLKIAKRVSKIKGSSHHELFINSDNWLTNRISGVWKSDASFNLLHMHGIEFHDECKKFIDFNLNGFLGDAILGGSYISEYQSLKFKVRNRGRRFINQALVLGESYLIHRKPFFDNDLTDLIFSIPEKLRKESYIYNKMILSLYPEYYTNIPWQKTGYSIRNPARIGKLVKFKNRVVNRIKRESQRFGFNLKDRRGFTEYATWIRREPARSFFEKTLLDKNALYPEYRNKKEVHACVKNHMNSKEDCSNELCLTLTFELWLQQIYKGKFREQDRN